MYVILDLFVAFFKTGLFAIGGGLATISFISEIGRTYQWFDTAVLTMMIAVSESTPGPLGINMATYVGYRVYGVVGALIATGSLVLPSIIIISMIGKMLDRFQNSMYVQGIFRMIKPIVLGFILSACLNIFLIAFFNHEAYNTSRSIIEAIHVKSIVLFVIGVFVYQKYKKMHPIVVIIGFALLGIIFKL